MRAHLFHGWWIVLAGFVIVAYGLGAQSYLQSLLAHIVRAELRGGADAFGWTTSMSGLAGGVAFLAAGPLVDRFGPRRLMLIGIPVASVGFLGLSIITNLFMLYICVALIGIGMSAGFLLPIQKATASWFVRKRSIAFAIVSVASILGGPLMILAGQSVADQFAWRGASLGLGLVMLAIGIPLALSVKHGTEQHGCLSGGEELRVGKDDGQRTNEQRNPIPETDFTLRDALRSRTFWLLSVAMALGAGLVFVHLTYTVHFLADQGITPETSFQITDIMPIMGMAGILVFGYLGDMFSKRHLLSLAIAIQSVSVLILITAGGIAQVYVYLLVFGLGAGIIPLLLAIRADYFGRRSFATITVAMTLVSFIITIPLSAFLPILGGRLYDATGGYQSTLLLSMLIGFTSAAVFLFSRPPIAKL